MSDRPYLSDFVIAFRKDKWHLIPVGGKRHSAVDYQWENLVMVWLMLKRRGDNLTILNKDGEVEKYITVRNYHGFEIGLTGS